MIRFGIRSKFTLSILSLVILSTLTITLVSVQRMEKIIIAESSAYLLGDLKDTANNVAGRIESIDGLTKTIISDRSVQRRLDDRLRLAEPERALMQRNMEILVNGIRLSRPEIDSMYIYGADGAILLGEISTPINKSLAFKPAEIGLIRTIAGLHSFPSPGVNTYVPFVKAIKSIEDFEILGYLQINLREKAIRDIFADKMPEAAGAFFVRDGNGQLLSYTGNDREATLGAIASDRAAAGQGYALTRLRGEKSVLARYEEPVRNWTYYVALPVDRMTGELDSIVYLNLLTAILFGIVAIGCSVAIGWGVSRPIVDIARSIRKVEHGDFNIQTRYEGKDEIGLLSRAFNKMVQEINRLINEVYRLQLLEQEQEIRTLQAQINPHFLYNAFDSISHLARELKAEPVSRMIVALGKLMRSSILNKTDTPTLGDELALIEHYLTLLKIRWGDKLQIHYDINPDLLDTPIPRLILQPVVENAIVHGLEGMEERGIIEITVASAADDVEIQIADNGKGMSDERMEAILSDELPYSGAGSGLGLRGVDKRLKLIYGRRYGVSLAAQPGAFTRVTIRLPSGSGNGGQRLPAEGSERHVSGSDR